MTINLDYMEFVCWIDRCLFPIDLVNDLIEMGMAKSSGFMYKSDFKHKAKTKEITISSLYQDYCVQSPHLYKPLTDDMFGYWLQLWLDKMYIKWQGYTKLDKMYVKWQGYTKDDR